VGMGLVLETLSDIRGQIATDDTVLAEARERRNLVAASAMGIGGALRRFSSGSVAHGTVNKPVTDADGGIVLDRRSYPDLGPDGNDDGPHEVAKELIELVGPKVRSKYPKAKVKRSRRGLLVTFSEPLGDDEDPTVDMIFTLTRKDEEGLWIPDLENGTWTASDPEKHTELFTAGTRALRALRARVTRLGKAWNKQWADGDRALSSFNIEALVWEFITDSSMSLDDAMAGWFRYAHDELKKGRTKDPAGVSDPIRLLLPKDTVVKRLGHAADRLEHALAHEDDEDAVREDLASVFHGYVDPPAGSKAATAAAVRRGNQGIGASAIGIVVGGEKAMKTTRAYGARRERR
jgi:hypothetical protein